MNKLNKTQSNKLNSFSTMSAQIRYLHSLDYTNGEISKLLSTKHNKLVRYQWVRNVLNTNVKTPKEQF